MGDPSTVKGKRALFIGRFQPFHMGHYGVIEEIVGEAEYLIIAIGSEKKSYTSRNPFTAGERALMIRRSLPSEWAGKCFIIPIDDLDRYNVWVAHVEDLVPPFDVVVGNSSLTDLLFSEKGYDIYHPREYSRDRFKGERIRTSMTGGEEWEEMVPEGAREVIRGAGGVERLAKIV